jgi:transposase-like protein
MWCEGCRRYFTPQPKPNGYDNALREQAVKLYLEGMSFRAVGRHLGIHYGSVVNWVNGHHDQDLPEQVEDQTAADTVEIDELFTYIGKKKTSVRSDGGS